MKKKASKPKRKVVGYLEGTDPLLLTRWASKGVETYPLSNGVDQHGKNMTLITSADNFSLVIGYLHKILPVSGIALAPEYLLKACELYHVPVFLLVPKEDTVGAKRTLRNVGDFVTFVDPHEAFAKTAKHLGL
ncbi:MAG: hypothetical protein AB1714_23700 [Acidobacteriota bacterium]